MTITSPCPIAQTIADIVPIMRMIVVAGAGDGGGSGGKDRAAATMLAPDGVVTAMTVGFAADSQDRTMSKILWQSPCIEILKSHKIETEDMGTQASGRGISAWCVWLINGLTFVLRDMCRG